ncbi:hypothetical protein G9A89_017617 [Geosiphon pyriformis]|nr:hypothetical protein G9A89_017617 [Geosiphon pyriformis]
MNEENLILSLINRIIERLPCNSGKKLETLETDPLVQQTVNAIVDLSRLKFTIIVNHLTQLLESISEVRVKFTDQTTGKKRKKSFRKTLHSSSTVFQDPLPFDVLHSQLFILKLLCDCMNYHWKLYRGSQKEILECSSSITKITNEIRKQTVDDSSSITLENINDDNVSNDNKSNPSIHTTSSTINQIKNNSSHKNILTSDSSSNKKNQKTLPSNMINYKNNVDIKDGNSQQPKRFSFKFSESWDDPPQLDDFLAKYILSVLSRLLHQMESQKNNLLNNQPTPGTSAAGVVGNNGNVAPHSSAVHDAICEIFKNAGHVIFYLSSSNWAVVFSRIKTRIDHLKSRKDEWPETTELKLLKYSNFNSNRLSMILHELSSSFTHLKRSVQDVIADVLKKAIWNWIEVFPAEFVALYQSQKRMKGGPDILFSSCDTITDNVRRRTVFWPLQTMLLILCPDMLSGAFSDTRMISREALFLDSLKKSLRNTRWVNVAAICYIDICKASTYLSKNESSALRFIVPEIENELKEKLFDPNKTFDLHPNPRLMSDCLTALFRLNHRNVLHSLFPVCLQENAPNAFKLALVKSCFTIVSEEHQLSWNPTISLMYSILASPLRKLFQDHIVNRDPHIEPRRKLGAKVQREEGNEKGEIILNILKLFKFDPTLAIISDSSDQSDSNKMIIHRITLCLNDFNPNIRTTAAETLLEFHDIKHIEKWGPVENKMYNFWCISSQVILAVARQISDSKEREEGAKYMLQLLLQLLIRRNDFLAANQESATLGINVPERLTSNVVLEIALLLLLCSADIETYSTAVTCFGHLCTEAQLTEDMDETPPSQLTIVENMNVYLKLSSATYMVTDQMAQQKRTRKLLRLMNKPTPGNLAAWEEAWKRWKLLTSMIIRPTDDSTSDETRKRGIISTLSRINSSNVAHITEAQITEWHNYTGFLSALGGCCVRDNQKSPSGTNSDRNPSTVHHNSNYHAMVETFISEMVHLLVCDSMYVRDIVKETLGADMSPRLYVILFSCLESIVGRFFDADGVATCTERYTLFVEQAISVLKLILDRIQDASENLHTVNFGGLVLSFARYLFRLGTGYDAHRIKIEMCVLAETLMLKKDYLTLRQEIILRNNLSEIILEWTSDFTLENDTQSGSENTLNKNECMHRDLDQACLKTLVALLRQLPLQPSDPVHEPDLSLAKSRLFLKYIAFFIGLLNRFHILKSKEYVKGLGPLKYYTIQALSNMLSANIDSGLRYSLSMGYHEDTQTRTAFMQVLTNILKQGTEFEDLAEDVIHDRYDKLVELITDSDLNIVISLCEVCPVSDIDEVTQVLLTVFESRNRTMPLLKAFIEKEVINTDHQMELFRRNSMTTKFLTAFGKLYGDNYLRETLRPLLQNFLKMSNELNFELDKKRIHKAENVQNNLSHVHQMAQTFLDEICASADNLPRSFREVCYYIATAVGEKFPDAKYTAVGAFIFLRFLCPVIVAPDLKLINPPPSKEARRGLLLITKIITNLANNVLFDAEEPFMAVLNDFLHDNTVKVTRFLQNISVLNSDSYIVETRNVEANPISILDDTNHKALQKYLFLNLERMGRELVTRRAKSINPSNGISEIDQTQANKRAYDKLSTLLAKLGPPSEIQKHEFSSINNIETNNHLFSNFMRRYSNQNLESISSKGLFYAGGVSKEKRPVFYFIAHRLSAESTDMELLMYHILHTIESSKGTPYELVVDLTQFGHTNEVKTQWIQAFIQILPLDAVENLEIRLPKSTTALDTEACVQFAHVTKISHYRVTIPVTMKISNEMIQVITSKKQDLFYGQQVTLNDVYHICEIEDISLSSHKNADNEFVIKQDNGRSSIAFTSPKRDQIMQVILASKTRFQLTKSANVTERVIRPKDVPGTLLNIALLNFGSDDPNLRLAAYNLLAALSISFNFDVRNQLLSAKGLGIPANNSFVVTLSERLARSEPHLTIEFLDEFFVGFRISSTQSKYFCLQYMAPWLLNLANYSQSGCQSQPSIGEIRKILRQLIELTAKESEMNNLVQSKVWSTLGRVDKITNLIIDEFINYAMDHGIGSSEAETVSNTIVTLSSIYIRGKVIARLRKVILRTLSAPTQILTENSTWPEIAVLVRFNLTLSFNNRLHIHVYLPESFYIVSMLVGTGAPLIRASIHSLLVNLIQSLCTAMPLEENKLNRLNLLLGKISESKFRHLFRLKEVGNAFLISSDSSSEEIQVIEENQYEAPSIETPLSLLEQLVRVLVEVMQCGAPSIDISNTWKARWMSLVTSTTFQYNPAIQPRGFVTLGCLASEEVEDFLLDQILIVLKGALFRFSENEIQLIVSIIMCLTNIVKNLSPESRYLRPMFWLAMSLVQIGHVVIFKSAIKLVQVVLDNLDANGFFKHDDIATCLLKARLPMAEVSILMDLEAGISYDHFSFAVAAALSKGLNQPATKTDTRAVLITFLEISSKRINPQEAILNSNMLGYLAALLPGSAKNNDIKELLWLCGILDIDVDVYELTTIHDKIFQKLSTLDDLMSLLLISLMVAMVQNAEHELERLFLYRFLADAAVSNYDSLLTKMNQTVASSDTLPILCAVQSIMYTIISESTSSKPHGNYIALLEDIGFKSLIDCGSFHMVKEKMHFNAVLSSNLVDKIIG